MLCNQLSLNLEAYNNKPELLLTTLWISWVIFLVSARFIHVSVVSCGWVGSCVDFVWACFSS